MITNCLNDVLNNIHHCRRYCWAVAVCMESKTSILFLTALDTANARIASSSEASCSPNGIVYTDFNSRQMNQPIHKLKERYGEAMKAYNVSIKHVKRLSGDRLIHVHFEGLTEAPGGHLGSSVYERIRFSEVLRQVQQCLRGW